MPALAFWNPSMAERKPASSASVPHVVKVRALPSLLAWGFDPEVENPPQAARRAGREKGAGRAEELSSAEVHRCSLSVAQPGDGAEGDGWPKEAVSSLTWKH